MSSIPSIEAVEHGEETTSALTSSTHSSSSSTNPVPTLPSDVDAASSHATPTEHRRNRKSWTEDEKRAFWKQKKAEKKERKRAAAQERQRIQQAEWEKLTVEEREARRAEAAELHERRRHVESALLARCEAQLVDPQVPVLVFDLSFSWCMTVADTKSTVSQVKFSYSSLRNAGFPFRPVITTLAGKEGTDVEHDATAQSEVLQALRDFEGFRRFPPQMTQHEHWSAVLPTEHVVFLTADASDVLTNIEPNTAYVIGAFVDHNQHKGLSYAAAQRHGVRSARLPIKESVELGNRCKVLTINHVVDVLIRYEALRAAGAPDWAKAIDEALPVRRTQQVAQGSRKRRRRDASGASVSGSEEDEGESEGEN